MRSRVFTSRLLLALSAALLIGCGEFATDPGTQLIPAKPGVANLWDFDPCFTDASWVCHAAPTFFGGGFDPYGQAFNCPDGCTTVAAGTAMRGKIRDLISTRVSSDPSCTWAKDFLRTSLNFNRIRWYVYQDVDWADSHWRDSSNATNADIHVWQGTFANDEQLIRTLMHEAAHVHFKIEQEDDFLAQAYSTACYNP